MLLTALLRSTTFGEAYFLINEHSPLHPHENTPSASFNAPVYILQNSSIVSLSFGKTPALYIILWILRCSYGTFFIHRTAVLDSSAPKRQIIRGSDEASFFFM